MDVADDWCFPANLQFLIHDFLIIINFSLKYISQRNKEITYVVESVLF